MSVAALNVVEAEGPAELRGRGRDDVRLMVARRGTGTVRHRRFSGIVDELDPGDLVVVNTSGTLPGALPAQLPAGARLLLHLSTPLPGGTWLVELREPSGAGSIPSGAGVAGEVLTLPSGGRATLLSRYHADAAHPQQRLWLAALDVGGPVEDYLLRHGRPIRYGHARRAWPIADYQTVFASHPGSVEMPSAARAFTPELVTTLVSRGVAITPVVLHAGVSSPEDDEAPSPERFEVPVATARWVNAARDAGSRVIAVGTTVVRALESVADAAGRIRPGAGWTELLIGEERGVRVVDGLLTGWHEPQASHLAMVEAVAGCDLLDLAYREAAEHGYRWHEFGDLCLILP